MGQLVLIESLAPNIANLMIQEDAGPNKNTFLQGVFMQAEIENGNKRVYPLDEIGGAVKSIMERIGQGYTIYGELNHPDNLQIDLNNVSHIISDMRMDGNNAIGKAKIVKDHPKGQIVEALLRAGGKLGVSSRGTGNVNEGRVSQFNFVTADIVANPSAPAAYPGAVTEALLESKKVLTLAEAVIHDPSAQKFFLKELLSAFEKLTGQQLNPAKQPPSQKK